MKPAKIDMNTQKRIAVLVAKNPDEWCNDKLYLEPFFKQEKWLYEEIVWHNPEINWKQYDGVLIRSTYDYIEHYEQFMRTLKHIEKQGIPLFNPLNVISWNSKKSYLGDLKSRGINIIETILTTPSQIHELVPIMKQNNWQECIVKPVISGGAYKTFRIAQKDAHTFDICAHFVPHEPFLIQPFAQEIIDEGEWSFVFFDKKFSHCMLSKPKQDDFRVQFFHGGHLQKANPEPWMIAEAERILNAAGFEKLLYARVDVIRRNNKLYVMELELIEPYLYFSYYPEAAKMLVKTLKKYIQ